MKPEDNSEAGAGKSCETPGCDKEAKLQCPTCIKLQIKVRIRFNFIHRRPTARPMNDM